MDVLIDTEMPDRCTDAPQKTQDIWGVQMLTSPHDIQKYRGVGGAYGCRGIQMYGGI